jgi:hypothetical protein
MFSMTPSQELIQIAEFFVEFVVSFGTDGHHGVEVAALERLGDIAAAIVADRFAVPHPEFPQRVLLPFGTVETGDDERPEIVALAGFIGPDVA